MESTPFAGPAPDAMVSRMGSRLSAISARAGILERIGPDPLVTSLAYDSREVKAGGLYFALPGLHTDGKRFIDAAIGRGAVAVVHEGDLERIAGGVAYLRVADARAAMSPIASDFYGNPSASLAVAGITGTEGKSTTVYLAWQLLRLAGMRAGFFSTVMSDSGGGEKPNPEHQTTPEAPTVHRLLAGMRDSGLDYAIVESSSHGLSARTSRLADVAFDVAVMTNVTHEHLEFHGSWEQYRSDKANLFRALDREGPLKKTRAAPGGVGRLAVVNADDPSAAYFVAATRRAVRSFSAKGAEADLSALDLRVDSGGESFTILERGSGGPFRHEARLELPGAFNVGNALAALLVVSGLCGKSVGELVPLLPSLRPVRGRMSSVIRGQPFEVLVDYAHTPSSFETVLPPLRARLGGRIICLFGSAGERDVEKRPQQGRIAAEYSDIVILSDEDPRAEEPMALLEDIAAGCPGRHRGEDLFLIPDRPLAIRKAFSLARPGDLVLLLGKGHENSIIYRSGARPYDEIGEAEAALAEMGYGTMEKP